MRPSAAVSTLLFFGCVIAAVASAMAAFAATREPGIAAVILIAGFALGAFLAASVKVVAEWERMIVLRLGRFQSVADPGMRLVVPVFDTTIFVDMRVQTVAITDVEAITQDNVPVGINGVIFFRVTNPQTAVLGVQDYRAAIWRLAQATLRDVSGKLALDDVLSQQDRLEAEITANIEGQSKKWGLHVEAIKLEDISVPEELKKMMSRQASSEREKRATIIKADGDRQAAAALAEAAATMTASPGAMQLRTLQTIDGLGPSASNTVVLALPLEIIEVMRAYVANAGR